MLREASFTSSPAPRALIRLLLLAGAVLVLWLLAGAGEAQAVEKTPQSPRPAHAARGLNDVDDASADRAAKRRGPAVAVPAPARPSVAQANRTVRDAVPGPAENTPAADPVAAAEGAAREVQRSARPVTETAQQLVRDADDHTGGAIRTVGGTVGTVAETVDGTLPDNPADAVAAPVDDVVDTVVATVPVDEESGASGREARRHGGSGEAGGWAPGADRVAAVLSMLDLAPGDDRQMTAAEAPSGQAWAATGATERGPEPTSPAVPGCPAVSSGAGGAPVPLAFVTAVPRPATAVPAPTEGPESRFAPAPASSPGCTPD